MICYNERWCGSQDVFLNIIVIEYNRGNLRGCQLLRRSWRGQIDLFMNHASLKMYRL